MQWELSFAFSIRESAMSVSKNVWETEAVVVETGELSRRVLDGGNARCRCPRLLSRYSSILTILSLLSLDHQTCHIRNINELVKSYKYKT